MYSMSGNSLVEKEAINAVTKYLESLPENNGVRSVEDKIEYQKKGIDLIWTKTDGTQILIEVKGDTYTKGNFAFETISNQSKNTPGCILYTQANFVYYYFTNWKKLYILPMPKTKEWFMSVKEAYDDVPVKNCDKRTGKYLYTTICKIVPIKNVLKAVPEILEIQL